MTFRMGGIWYLKNWDYNDRVLGQRHVWLAAWIHRGKWKRGNCHSEERGLHKSTFVSCLIRVYIDITPFIYLSLISNLDNKTTSTPMA